MKNRVDNPKWWGTTLAEVVCKKWQFSSMTDPKDHQLATWPTAADKEFAQALLVVDGVIWKKLPAQFPGADSYYDISIPEPAWAWKSIFLGQEGRLRFYNTDGDHPDNS
jgi:spore germination cell wall hydrolase CwlJ-like protein